MWWKWMARRIEKGTPNGETNRKGHTESYVVGLESSHTQEEPTKGTPFFISDLIQLYCLQRVSNNCVLIIRKAVQAALRYFIKHLYRGADKSLARPGRKQARKHVRDARDFNKIETRAVIKFFFSVRQGAEGNSRHSDRNFSLFPS